MAPTPLSTCARLHPSGWLLQSVPWCLSSCDCAMGCRCRKILKARLWPSEDGSRAWDRSVTDIGGEVLLVSQFTLYGRLNGNRLDFSQALRPQQVADLCCGLSLAAGLPRPEMLRMMLLSVPLQPVFVLPCKAAPLWDNFIARVGSEYRPDRVRDGRFGAYMKVSLDNDGPVTISLDSNR